LFEPCYQILEVNKNKGLVLSMGFSMVFYPLFEYSNPLLLPNSNGCLLKIIAIQGR
jgi:hypothetical protein